MGKTFNLHCEGIASVIYWVIALLILSGCVTVSEKDAASVDGSKTPVINSIKVNPSPGRIVVELINNRPIHYTAFKLIDPPRIILDLGGTPGASLPLATLVNRGNVKDIYFEKSKTRETATRMTISLTEPMQYKVEEQDRVIRLSLSNETPEEKAPAAMEAAPSAAAPDAGTSPQQQDVQPSQPRIFVKPGQSALNQILGIDFTMLAHGKSRVIVTTDKKSPYDIERKGSDTLVLQLTDAVIPSNLLRDIDSSHFEGAVTRIRPSFSPSEKKVSIAITLREMVPFHVQQTDKDISIEFGTTSIKPAIKKIIPLQMARTETQPPDQVEPAAMEGAMAPMSAERRSPVPATSRYTGEPMTMDFVNADITNILRLIGEVSNLNIVWGPEVKGNVSMRLKNVPWDQALDLILTNNGLAKRITGNVVWITTRAKMTQLEAEEKRKKDEKEKEIEDRIQKAKADQEKEKALEPLVTEYIGVDFATVDEIKTHIERILTERGTLTSDARTNIMIIKDIQSVIDEAKEIVKKFDTPVKQVMIQARIVDATDRFTRNLGIQWGPNTQAQFRNNTVTEWSGTPIWAPNNVETNYPNGGNLYNPSITSITPPNPSDGYSANLGLVFAKLSPDATVGFVLDTQLALAETEGDIKIISAPKILASNGEEATITRGTTIIIPPTENVASTTLNAALSLTVTPTVSYNDYVTMQVDVKDDTNASTTQFDTKAVTTKLMVKSGETIVIGGIYKDERSTDTSGIPGLSRIPLLGWLFKTEAKSSTKTELLIFITPTVLPSS